MFEKAAIDGDCEREAPPATSIGFGAKLWLSEVGRATADTHYYFG
jgi:hypothetical protein